MRQINLFRAPCVSSVARAELARSQAERRARGRVRRHPGRRTERPRRVPPAALCPTPEAAGRSANEHEPDRLGEHSGRRALGDEAARAAVQHRAGGAGSSFAETTSKGTSGRARSTRSTASMPVASGSTTSRMMSARSRCAASKSSAPCKLSASSTSTGDPISPISRASASRNSGWSSAVRILTGTLPLVRATLICASPSNPEPAIATMRPDTSVDGTTTLPAGEDYPVVCDLFTLPRGRVKLTSR